MGLDPNNLQWAGKTTAHTAGAEYEEDSDDDFKNEEKKQDDSENDDNFDDDSDNERD